VHFAVGESTVIATLAARQKKRDKFPGQESKFTYYCSEQAHYSVFKGINITGSKPYKIPVVWSETHQNYIMDMSKLKDLIEKHEQEGLIPTYVCGTIGTTGTCAVDDITGLGNLSKEKDMWFHIDAAYLGNTFILKEFHHIYSKGVELSQSLAINGNKFMPVSENSGFFFVEEAKHVFKALNNDIVFYLQYQQDQKSEMINYEVGTARGSKSLRLFMVFKTIGFEYIRDMMRRLIGHAKRIEETLIKDGRFKIFVPQKFALVCFQFKDRSKVELERFLNFVNDEGKILIGPFILNGDYFLRISLNNQYLMDEKITEVVEYLKEAYNRVFVEEEQENEKIDQ